MKKIAKHLTLALLVVAFIVGCVGAFIESFQIEGYTTFLKGFTPIYISLIASIGANSAVEKMQEKKQAK